MTLRCAWPVFAVFVALPLLWGCSRAKDAPVAATAEVTFSRDIAPILYARCAKCHREGEAAPFSLLTYEDARARAKQIRDVTQSRFMPPWLPEAGHESFQEERRLSEAEIDLLSRWVAGGAAAGDPHDLPDSPKFTEGWQLGTPDLVLESPAFQLPAEGPDRFRNFVLSVPIDGPRWIRAVELRPENPRVTHHARVGIDTTLESERRDAADPAPGYEGMAWGQDPKGQLITWTPGMTPDGGAAGVAWKLAPDMKLVLHTHLQPSGKEETVRFRVGFYTADGPPTIQPLILRIGSRDIDIAASQTGHVANDVYTLPIDIVVQSVFPHAHKLCQEIVVEAALPDGQTRTLIAIRHFDEKWHDKYRLAEPLRLPRGTRLRTTFTYDNSAANVRNPHRPPERVVYGSNANDEMSDVFLQVTPADPAQFAVLEEHQTQAELRSKIVGYGKTLEMYPADNWSVEALASCYVANHEPQQAIQLLESHRELLETSPQAGTIAGMARLAAGDAAGAEAVLRQALVKEVRQPLAWLGLGQALVAEQRPQPAANALRRAVELAPRLTVARLDLIDLLVSQGQLDEAATAAQAAIDIAPDEHLPLMKLANIYARQKKYDASLAAFAAAKKIAPFVYSPQSSLAILCYELEDEPTADRLLHEAIALDDADPVPWFFLGQIARRNSAWTEARKNLQRASDLPVPRSWPASHVRQFLKLVYTEQLLLSQQLEDRALARDVLRKWSEFEPENAGVRKLLLELDADGSQGASR